MGTAVAEQEETQHVWQLPERLGLVPDLDRLRAQIGPPFDRLVEATGR